VLCRFLGCPPPPHRIKLKKKLKNTKYKKPGALSKEVFEFRATSSVVLHQLIPHFFGGRMQHATEAHVSAYIHFFFQSIL
jgi:hypothetical protein